MQACKFVHTCIVTSILNHLYLPSTFHACIFTTKEIMSLNMRTLIPGTRIQVLFLEHHNIMKVTFNYFENPFNTWVFHFG
jgi:hypothetical protein